MFTTEGHIVSVDERFRNSLWEDILPGEEESSQKSKPTELKAANFSSNVRKAPAWGREVGRQDKQSPLEMVLDSVPFRNVKYLRSSCEIFIEQQHHVRDSGEGEICPLSSVLQQFFLFFVNLLPIIFPFPLCFTLKTLQCCCQGQREKQRVP